MDVNKIKQVLARHRLLTPAQIDDDAKQIMLLIKQDTVAKKPTKKVAKGKKP